MAAQSEGLYELNLSFVADSASTLVDAARQTRLDGDADGSPGGQFDFWFQSGPTIFVDKMNSTTSAPEGTGSLADPYDTISTALAAAASRIVVPATGGQALTDGDQILIGDGMHAVAVFEFDQDGQTRSGQSSASCSMPRTARPNWLPRSPRRSTLPTT